MICCYAECRYAEYSVLFMIMLSVSKQTFIMLSVIVQIVIMLSAIILSVVAPLGTVNPTRQL